MRFTPIIDFVSGLGLEDLQLIPRIIMSDVARHQFAEVYINGIYHGVYSMQERINENWLKVNMKVKEPIIVSSWSDQTHADFVEMMVFLEGADDQADSIHTLIQFWI